jgi:hypothetical protein
LNAVEEPVAWADAAWVWPNPATDFLSVRCPSSPGTCRLLDATGRTLAERRFAANDQLEFALDGLPGGACFVVWHTENGWNLSRFIIQ